MSSVVTRARELLAWHVVSLWTGMSSVVTRARELLGWHAVPLWTGISSVWPIRPST